MSLTGATRERASRIEPLTLLATGGMADIWLSREVGAAGMERLVVVKRLLPHLAREPELVDMFVSEARFVARLVHPNVVQIHDLGQDDDGYFLVMEYVAGCSVSELLAAAASRRTSLPLAAFLSIAEQACLGAHAAHELCDPTGDPLGLVHRDISPHNLMVGPSGEVKLLDFGIAKATAAAEATRTGSLKGKHGYMSPEQCSAARLDRRSDVFALGIVCWELLTGARLFKRETEYATMHAIVSEDVRPPSAVRPDLPAAFDGVIAKALARSLEERWPTADALRRALVAAAEASGIRASRDALVAAVTELLGDKLRERERALRDAARSGRFPEPRALRAALVTSDSSAQTPARSDDATVAEIRPSPRAVPEPATAERAAGVQEEGPRGGPPPEQAPARSGRSRVVALLAPALVALAIVAALASRRSGETAPTPAAGSASASSPAPPAGPPLRFVVAPTVNQAVIRSELAPFLTWLGRTLARPVELTIADSYDDTGERVAAGRADFGLMPPLLFVRTEAREPRLQPLAVRLFDGSRASDGYVLMRDDAPLGQASDLRGRRICYVDRSSTTGYLLPRIWLRKAGLVPDRDVQGVISGDHIAAMRDLAAGKCDAAAVYSGAYLTARQEGISVGQLRVMTVTGRVPQDLLVAAPAMPAAEVQRLREVLLGFEPRRDIGAARIGEVLGITGFAALQTAEFKAIREAAESEGLIPAAAPR